MSLETVTLRGGESGGILKRAAIDDTDYLRSSISTRDWEDVALAALRARLQRAERDAVRLYFELRGLVDSHDSAMELALRALGCSLEVAQQAVMSYRQVSGMDRLGIIDAARLYLEREGYTVLAPERGLAAGGASKLPSQGDAGSAMIPAADGNGGANGT